MQWRGRRESTNVEDARGRRRGGVAGLSLLVGAVGRRFGTKGLLVLAVLGVVGWQLGLLDPSALPQDGGRRVQATGSAAEEQRVAFVRVVLADTEDVWREEFRGLGQPYREPQLVVYRGQHPTACGLGASSMGPFYCPADQTIYIDLGFYDELESALDAPGDFAQAYVLAHEVGHHVQNLLGITRQVEERRGRADENEASVRLELQADFLAGVWAHHNQRYLDRGDIEEALRAANRIGDDALQERAQGRAVPHTFTHGTSAQRMRWFRKGLESGSVEDGDTFELSYDEL